MKTLKKVLAVVLALAMVLGMAVTASATFTDAAEISAEYKEAVEVMNAVGVFVGSNGKMNPKANLTRAEAAKLITYLLVGEDVAEALPVVSIFKDVDASNWANKYVAYLYNEKIVSGVGAGKFNPQGQVTGYEFGKMLLVALGYDPEIEGLTGTTWAVNTSKLMSNNGIAKAVKAVATAALTREEAAQYCLNALKATCVEYKGNSTITAGNVTVKTTAAASKVDTIGYDTIGYDVFLQLGEKLYKGDLVKVNGTTTDGLGRPSTTWNYDTKEVGTYAAKADHTVVVKKKGKTIADAIDTASKKFEDALANDSSHHNYFINGAETVTGPAYIGPTTETEVGDIVEIFLDENDVTKVATVAIIRYSAGQLSAAPVTKGKEADDTLEVRLPGVTALTSYKDADKVLGYEGLAKNDVVYFYADNEDVYHLAKAEKLTGKLTSYTTGNPTKYTIDGKQYVVNTGADPSLTGATNTTYDYFLDNNGYIVFAKATEKELSDYVVLQDIAWVSAAGIANGKFAEARLVKLDGTTEIVKVASITNAATTPVTYELAEATSGTKISAADAKSTYANKFFFTYELNSDGDYELAMVKGDKIANGSDTTNAIGTYKASSGTFDSIKVNDETVFVVVNDPAKATPSYKVYTGKNSVPNFTNTVADKLGYVYVTKSDMAQYVYVFAYETADTTGDKVYFLADASSVTSVKKEDNTTYEYSTYKAVVNGKLTDVNVKSTCTTPAVGSLYTPTYNADGIISALTDVADRDLAFVYGYSFAGTTLTTSKSGDTYANAYNCPADTVVILKDTDGEYTQMTAAEITADANDRVYVVVTSSDAHKVELIYIQEQDADETGIVATDTTPAKLKGVATPAAGSAPAYTTFTGASGKDVTITCNGGCLIQTASSLEGTYSGSDYNTKSFDTTGTYYVKVTAEDTSVAYYVVVVTA